MDVNDVFLKSLSIYYQTGIIQLFGHCNPMWYAMSWSLVKLMERGTSRGEARQ